MGMGKMLGSNMSDEELEEIAKEVESKLADSVDTLNSELKEDAQGFLQDEVNQIENNVDTEQEEGVSYGTIENDVMASDQAAVIRVRDEISDEATAMRASLRGRAAEFEKEVLEERLSERLGKKIKLVVVDDEIQGIDELFNGLPSFGGSPANGGYRPQQQQQGGYRPQQQQGGYRPQQQQQGGYRPQQQQGGYRPQQQQQRPQQQQQQPQQQQPQQQRPQQPQQQRPAVKAAPKQYFGYGIETTPAGYGHDQDGGGALPPLP
jgi:hypothetical protein